MLKNVTPAQVTLIKYVAVAAGAYWLYNKVTTLGAQAIDAAGEVAATSLNPMHKDNLANQAAENIVGADNLASAGTTFFDWIDSAAEAVGFENGINGIPGTTAGAIEQQNRQAGNAATAKFGGNANG